MENRRNHLPDTHFKASPILSGNPAVPQIFTLIFVIYVELLH